MVKFSSKLLAILLIVTMTISCDNQEISPRRKTLDQLTEGILSSRKFKELDVDRNELHQSGSLFTNPQEDAVVIPFKGQDGKKFVMALINEKQQIRKVFTFEAITDVTPELISAKMQAKEFTGSFRFSDRSGYFQIDLEKSKIVSNTISKSALARVADPECGDWTSTTGPLACAGARIEGLNWFDKTICYATFGYCFSQTVASCIIDDCVVNPDEENEE